MHTATQGSAHAEPFALQSDRDAARRMTLVVGGGIGVANLALAAVVGAVTRNPRSAAKTFVGLTAVEVAAATTAWTAFTVANRSIEDGMVMAGQPVVMRTAEEQPSTALVELIMVGFYGAPLLGIMLRDWLRRLFR